MSTPTLHIDRAFALILAGGEGKRLWPLSRSNNPKQFLPFYGTQSLLERTMHRMHQLVGPGKQIVVTSVQHEARAKEISQAYQAIVIREPQRKNTTAAVALGCLTALEQDSQAIIIILPADHHIDLEDAFARTIKEASRYALSTDHLILIGVKPSYAATAYGYICKGSMMHNTDQPLYQVHQFHEKPSADLAALYVAQDHFLWNTGIVCCKASVLMHEFMQQTPHLLDGIKDYANLPSISFDHAILEKTKNSAVLEAEFQWADVGNLEHYLAAKKIVDNDSPPQTNIWHAKNNIASSKKMVVFAGVNDICIIDTEDVLLVIHRNEMMRAGEIQDDLSCNEKLKYT